MKFRFFSCAGALASFMLLDQSCSKMQAPPPSIDATTARAATLGVPPSASNTIVSLAKDAFVSLVAGDGTPGLANGAGIFADPEDLFNRTGNYLCRWRYIEQSGWSGPVCPVCWSRSRSRAS